MKKFNKQIGSLFLTLLTGLSLLSQSVSAEEEYGIRAFYGDRLLDRVVVIDVKNMALTAEIPTVGVDPYPVDQAGELDKVYAITRGSNSIDIIDASTLKTKGLIELEHYPRSAEAYNSTLGLQLVTGADKPMASLIDVKIDKVVATVGDSSLVFPIDYGGSNATGHPFWFSDDKFALIDRGSRTIQMYKVKKAHSKGRGKGRGKGRISKWKVIKLDSVNTPTAVHHFIKRDLSVLRGQDRFTYFALSEGSPDSGISPAVLKYILKGNNLIFVEKVDLAVEGIENMGSHHADMHPNGKLVYVGSTEGNMYVVNIKSMEVVKTIEAGLGAGHTTFVPKRNIAIVTNHKDKYITVIDTIRHQNIKNIIVSGESINGEILQSHSSFVSPDMNFFYAFATDNGIFYELDLEKLEVTRTLETGGTPLQGVFMCQGGDCQNSM